MIIDNKHVLQAQVDYSNSTLTSEEKRLFAVDGKLHAHVLGGRSGNAKIFAHTWLSEYLQGRKIEARSHFLQALYG